MEGVANRIYQLHSGILFLLPAATESATQVGHREGRARYRGEVEAWHVSQWQHAHPFERGGKRCLYKSRACHT